VRLFRRFGYRIPKDDLNAQSLFERAREVVRNTRRSEQPIRFFLEDSITSTYSATDRACKDFPELEPFRSDVVFNGPGGFSDLPGLPALSNLPDCWDQANRRGQTGYVDPDVLSAVLAGVPKPYPFDHVTLMLDDIDWAGTGERPSPR
jgi:hypothetical protein